MFSGQKQLAYYPLLRQRFFHTPAENGPGVLSDLNSATPQDIFLRAPLHNAGAAVTAPGPGYSNL